MARTLILSAPADVELTLFQGKTELPPANAAPCGGLIRRSYLLPEENETPFWVRAEGEGRYKLEKNLNICRDGLVIDIDPGKRKGAGYEAKGAECISDEAAARLLTAKPDWRERFPEAYETPTLAAGEAKAAHEFTSHEEMLRFLEGLRGRCARYSLETSPVYGLEMSLLIFSRDELSEARRWEEAVDILKEDGRLNLLYMAQIHGSEPAGVDAALAVAEGLARGGFGPLADRINLVIIPRVNPDGARDFTRDNAADHFDMNRDHIKVRSAEVAAVHRVFNRLLPEVLIDGHEYYKRMHVQKLTEYKDVLLGVGGGVNTGLPLRQVSTGVTNAVIAALNREGLRVSYYPVPDDKGAVKSGIMVNTCNFSSGRGYFSLLGSVSLLVESLGLGFGKQGYERRVLSQVLTVRTLLEEISARSEEIRAAVRAERDSFIREGGKFSPDKRFCLYSGSSFSDHEEVWNPLYDLTTGESPDPERRTSCYYYDKAERERARATAYVIARDLPHIDEQLTIIQRHDLRFETLPEGASLPLRQYGGTPIRDEKTGYFRLPEAELSAERETVFPAGAYLFPCAQQGGLLLMYLFEPDVTDTDRFGSSFCQSGLLKPEDIFRLERDYLPSCGRELE